MEKKEATRAIMAIMRHFSSEYANVRATTTVGELGRGLTRLEKGHDI